MKYRNELDSIGKIKVPGLPWKFSETNCEPGKKLALRGMDNQTVLSKLGYSEAEINNLYKEGAITEAEFSKAKSILLKTNSSNEQSETKKAN